MHVLCSTHSVILNAMATHYTQWRPLPPLTSTVKSSLFTHVPSSPLSLAARLHQCCTNCSHYINNGWTISGQTSYSIVYKKPPRHWRDILKMVTVVLNGEMTVIFKFLYAFLFFHTFSRNMYYVTLKRAPYYCSASTITDLNSSGCFLKSLLIQLFPI